MRADCREYLDSPLRHYTTMTVRPIHLWNNRRMRIHPVIIQGGMGAAISDWRLARAVSSLGQLGVVSGVALDVILTRRLQDGDPGGNIRQALDEFPEPAIADRIRETYYIPGGKAPDAPYKVVPMPSKNSRRDVMELLVVANFVEVFLARLGHRNPVGINYLEKVQTSLLPSVYGAMLAGVSYVLMGAGIPIKVPGVLDALAKHERASYPLHVTGAEPEDDVLMSFDPKDYIGAELPPLLRPNFLAIVSSNVLATTMLKRSNGRVDGFVIEGPTAGGHNAPPRGKLQVDESGEAVYGERDRVDLARIRELGLPFWLAGGYGSATKVHEALDQGAAGVQVGTAFAFCEESGLREDYKQALLASARKHDVRVVTDMLASPTNFPFKSAQLAGTVTEDGVYDSRPRVCDLGYLREAYRTESGTIAFRCAAEPITTYVAKHGKVEDTVGKKCLCNSLLANVGLAQVRPGNYVEQGLVTAGNQLTELAEFLPADGLRYTAADVIAALLASVHAEPMAAD